MELRHLRGFLAVAEELHFGRAAMKLNIEQSPLSRIIKDLENQLGVLLFERTSRHTSLTPEGNALFEYAKRILLLTEQAKDNVRSVSAGASGQIRIAVSEGEYPEYLRQLLLYSRSHIPSVELRVTMVPVVQQLKGLRSGLYDVGLSLTTVNDESIVAKPFSREPLVVLIPAGHDLQRYSVVTPEDVINYPLVMWDKEQFCGRAQQIDRILNKSDTLLQVVETVSSLEWLLVLVSTGYGIGFITAAQVTRIIDPNIRVINFKDNSCYVTSYFLHARRPSGLVRKFLNVAFSKEFLIEQESSCLSGFR